jgi:hypothetical protein
MQSIQDVPIVKAAVAYDDPITGETFVIIINQALYFGNQIDEILLNPNQIREYGHIVNDVPKHLGGSTHSIISSDQQIDIPLKLRGIISYFPVRTPTLQEIENCVNLILTSDKEWQPYSDDFQQEERKHEYYDLKAVKKDLFLSHKELSNRWAIPEATAKQTLQVTTQTFIRNVQLPIERRSRTKNVMLKYNRLKCRMYSNTFFSNIVSIQGHKCGQLFTTDFGYCRFVPMKTKSDAGYALQDVLHDSGIPNHIHTDGAKELVQGKWKDICRDANIEMTQTEPHSPWQNRTEIEIRELKRHAKRFMARTKTPSPLWDYCCQYTTEFRNHLARPLPHLHGRTPHEVLTGNTPDISELLEFSWYEPIWYFDTAPFPEQTRKIARWIGVAHKIGQAMCFWIIPSSGIPIARSTIQKISPNDLMTDQVKMEIQQLDQALNDNVKSDNQEAFLLYHNDRYEEDIEEDEPIEPDAQAPDIEDIETNAYDELLLVKPLLEKDGELIRAKITGRKRDALGNLVGCYDPNPLLNTRIYLAEFPDGYIQEYTANSIAESI